MASHFLGVDSDMKKIQYVLVTMSNNESLPQYTRLYLMAVSMSDSLEYKLNTSAMSIQTTEHNIIMPRFHSSLSKTELPN